METLIQTVRKYNQDIGMEFSKEKCILQIMWDGKWDDKKIEQLNQEKIRILRKKKTYNYHGILEADIIKRVDMKGQNKKEYLRWVWKQLET